MQTVNATFLIDNLGILKNPYVFKLVEDSLNLYGQSVQVRRANDLAHLPKGDIADISHSYFIHHPEKNLFLGKLSISLKITESGQLNLLGLGPMELFKNRGINFRR